MFSNMLKKYSDKPSYIFIFLFLVAFVLFMWNNSYTAIWFDESFSIRLSQRSFNEIIDITSKDVHPPLYYLMLKVFCSIFGYSIAVVRFFSLIPILLIIILTSTIYRKILGNKIAANFIILLLLMPVMLYTVSEIRMYSWCMFWVFLATLFAYKSYERLNILNLSIYIIASLGAAYTHNYGLITIFYLYLVLLIFVFLNKRKSLLPIIGIGLVIAILYIPWLIQLLNQMGLVKEEYWILPIGLGEVIGYIFFPYDFSYPQLETPSIIDAIKPKLFLILFLLFIVLFIKAQFSQNNSKKNIANISLILYILPGLTGIIVSVLIKPVFISRYLICSMVFLFVAYSIYIALLDFSKKADKVIIISFFSILFLISTTNFVLNRQWGKERENIQSTFVKYIEENNTSKTAFLYYEPSSFPIGVYSVLFPENKHFAYSDTTIKFNKLHQTVLKNITYTPIRSYKDIDTSFTQLICVENYEGKRNIMYREKDSAEIVKTFKIKDKISIGLAGYSLYRLERRKQPE